MRRLLTAPCVFFLLSAATLLFPGVLHAQRPSRIIQAIDAGESQPLRGNVHPLARVENDQGQAAAAMMLNRMVMTFSPSATQQTDLDALLSEQQNPLSPYYHQWLTPEQFADRFGLSSPDLAKVVDWLQGQGFSVDETARSRTYVAFSGTAAQVDASFGTAIHHFVVNGEMHYANSSEPKLPWPLANVVTGIRGLNDFRPRARGGVGRSAPRPQFTSNISGNHFLAPDDFATIYNLKPLYSSGIDGSGQGIVVVGQTDLVMSDITTFRSLSGLPAKSPSVVLVPGSADPGVVTDDIGEANLDVQWAGAVARNAGIIYVNSKNGAFDSMFYAISQNLAPVISISYGDCEQHFSASDINSLKSVANQANAQGQTIVGPSGDSGAADCDFPPNANTTVTSATQGLAVDLPAALPTVTGAGGTTFSEGVGAFWSPTNNASNGSALSYIPETSWNDTSFEIANKGSLAATGGGVSKLFAKPSWQVGAGVPNDGKRDVPDISFNASFDHDGYLVCSQGSCSNGFRNASGNLFVVGGTSAGAPVFAGIVALINQQLGAAQGNVNPRLYALAGSSTDAFHDITTGDNKVPCTAGSTDCPSGGGSIGFSAGAGYDLVTGLGSVNAANLVNEFSTAPDFQPSLSASSMTLTAGASGNVGTSTLTITARNGFSGTIAFACSVSSSLPGTTCSVSPASLNSSGTATVTVTAPTTRASLRPPRLFPHFFPWTDGSFAIAAGLLLAGKRERGSTKTRMAILAILLIVGIAMMIGCGGGGSSSSSTATGSSSSGSTVTGTGTATVTATSGSVVHTTAIAVTVN
jgi:pseudomonalisin